MFISVRNTFKALVEYTRKKIRQRAQIKHANKSLKTLKLSQSLNKWLIAYRCLEGKKERKA